jgi:hypothetical protein
MALQAIAFYLMAAVTLASGIAVVSAKNPVHSVLFLIAAFFSAAGLFVLLGAEFLAMLLVAMNGAIVLSLRHKPGVRRQVIMDQVLRTPATGMRMVSPKPGEGIDA